MKEKSIKNIRKEFNMSQIVSNCQKHWKNILNYMRK